MRLLFAVALCLLAPGLSASSAGAGDFHSPPKGSALRTGILDAARPTFEKEIGGPIEFVVTTLNVYDDWAYGDVKIQRPGGKPIDWSKTKFAEDFKQGMLETGHNLFLLQEGGDGWGMVEYAIGPTDVAWDWWRQQHNLPAELFGASSKDYPPVSRPRPQSGN